MTHTEDASCYLKSLNSLNPEITVNSGQMFLWENYKNSWYGVYKSHILKFSLDHKNSGKGTYDHLYFDSLPELDNWQQLVFRLDDDINYISSCLTNDNMISQLFKKYSGLWLMRQDPFQCMISFACSSNTNIPMIRRMLKNLCRKFGIKREIDQKKFFTFPTTKSLAKASINELCSCGIGYRAKTIKSLTEKIIIGTLNIEELSRCKYDEAKEKLLGIYGIGNKLADCILLFSLEKTEAFPIDVWIARSIYSYYRALLNQESFKLDFKSTKLSPNKYNLLSKIMRQHFGKYAGYAQQYLYYHMRCSANKKW
ncbi:MAG TPA: DNA glycosylase [Nitrososphaeraceae archaeon]|nr:DNA glycosylase [Nitrososphaeraceae archaeon]